MWNSWGDFYKENMSNSHPLISVIIPVYNGAAWLAEALDSVIRQSHRPLEIIVVDDGSTDNTVQVVNTFSAGCNLSWRYVYQENQGPAAARNRGLAMAEGEFVAFQDADDVWMDDKLSQQLALLKQYPLAKTVLGQTQWVQLDANGRLVSMPGALRSPRLLPHLHAALFRQEIFKQVGLLDETLRCGEDLDWYLRALEQNTSIVTHPETVLLYRRHDSNLTRNCNIKSQLLHMIKRSLDRRRDGNLWGNLLQANFIAAQRGYNDKT
jgi:glycosyltransferase involved in cell wall biosynthesis